MTQDLRESQGIQVPMGAQCPQEWKDMVNGRGDVERTALMVMRRQLGSYVS